MYRYKATSKKTGMYDSGFEAEFHAKHPELTYNDRRTKKSVKLFYTVRKAYHPDFYKTTDGRMVFVETKGYFKSSDRTKMLAVQEANPDAQITIVLQSDGWVTKAHKQRYSDWCKKHGFPVFIKNY